MKWIKSDESCFDELRCAICKDYLISFPIRVAENGERICGSCEPREGVDPLKLYKDPLLEVIVKNSTFACKNKENGCDAEFSYDFIEEHQEKCVYVPVVKCLTTMLSNKALVFTSISDYHTCKLHINYYNCCSNSRIGICTWSGLAVDLHHHMMEYHKTWCMFNQDSVKLKLGESDISDFRILIPRNIPFLIEYKFEAATKKLILKISYISSNIKEAAYKITDVFGKTLAKGNCDIYMASEQNSLCLKEAFETSDSQELELQIQVTSKKYNCFILDEGKLSVLKCVKCCGYLIPFGYHSNLGLVCGFCADEQNINDKVSLTMIQNTNFQCKWHYCNFVSKASQVFEHQKFCRFQTYQCNIEGCKKIKIFPDMKQHLIRNHRSQFIELNEYSSSPIFTIKKGTFIIVTRLDKTWVFSTFGNLFESFMVQFRHTHCSLKSRPYQVSDKSIVSIDSLPHCFKAFDCPISMRFM